jgi:hypothetical protein
MSYTSWNGERSGSALIVVCLLVLSCGGTDKQEPTETVGDVPSDQATLPDALRPGDLPGGEGAGADLVGDVPVDIPGPGDTVPAEVPGTEVATFPHAFMPPPFKAEKFTVNLRAQTTSGVVGQVFSLEVVQARGKPGAGVVYAWDFDGGDADPANPVDGAVQAVSFAEAGTYLVSVTATDGDGDSTSAGTLIRVFAAGGKFLVGDVDGDGEVAQADWDAASAHLEGAKLLPTESFRRADVDLDGRLREADLELIAQGVEDGLGVPTKLWPAQGALGRKIRLIHPALLDPAVGVVMVFEGAEPLVPVRGLPGYATFIVPPELDKPGTVKLALQADGKTADEWDFEVLPLPQASKEPGSKVLLAMELLEEALVAYPEKLDTFLGVFSATPEQAAAIQGMMEVARDSFITHRQAFAEAFSKMEPEGRAAFEQIALANGLDEVIERLQGLDGGDSGGAAPFAGTCALTPGQAATLLGVLCAALDIADIASQVAEINSIAADYLGWFDWWPLNTLPIVGQVINFLSSLSNAISALTDLVGMIAEFLPDIGEMKVEASPAALELGAAAQAKASVKILLGSKLCSAGLGALIGSLMDQIKDMLTNKLGASIPLASSAFKQYDFDREKMDTVTGLVYDAVGGIVGAVVDALGLQDALTSLANAICDALGGDPWLPLGPEVLSASCGSMNNGAWTCVEACIGGVTVNGKSEICGKARQAQAGLECKGCGEGNCAGCCDGKASCLAIASQSDQKCGKGGAACAPCQAPDSCVAGTCQCQSTCTVIGARSCVGNDVWECTEVKPGCLRLVFDEPCINGAVCAAGNCEGGCNGSNCSGCCLGNGDCVAPPTKDHCGIGGSTCGYCGGAFEECVGGVCTCDPQCDGKECGDDECGGTCGTCLSQSECKEGLCECVPDCFLADCGPDGCGGSCGTCTEPEECIFGSCDCVPDCFMAYCGPDGCGGSCGTCDPEQQCVDGLCMWLPTCQFDWECGNGTQCLSDLCIDGKCTIVPKNGLPCNDGDLCTVQDKCFAGDCIGVPKTCDDGNVCTEDSCDLGECKHDPLSGIPCDDGADCTTDDHCENGKCIGTPKETPETP